MHGSLLVGSVRTRACSTLQQITDYSGALLGVAQRRRVVVAAVIWLVVFGRILTFVWPKQCS